MTDLLKPSWRRKDYIEPAFEEFVLDPLSERRANILASAIDHQADWTYEYVRANEPARLPGDGSLGDFRRDIFNRCPELRAMSDLSDASHHRFLTRKRDPGRTVTTSTAAYLVEENELVVQGYDRAFMDLADKSLSFWKNWKE